MAITTPGTRSRAISALTYSPILARRSEDMPTSSGLARGNGSSALAITEQHRVATATVAETACIVFMASPCLGSKSELNRCKYCLQQTLKPALSHLAFGTLRWEFPCEGTSLGYHTEGFPKVRLWPDPDLPRCPVSRRYRGYSG